jgi:hypothetical protein
MVQSNGEYTKMKLTNFISQQLKLMESELDDILAQPGGPNKLKQAAVAGAKAIGKVATAAGKGAVAGADTSLNIVKNTANAATKVLGTSGGISSPGQSGHFKNVDLFGTNKSTSTSNDEVEPTSTSTVSKQMIDTARNVTKGKVATKPTDVPEVNDLLKKLQVLKR